MITTTMRSIVPDELIAPLKILGKYDWVWWTMTDKSPLSTSVELRLPTDPELSSRSWTARSVEADRGRGP